MIFLHLQLHVPGNVEKEVQGTRKLSLHGWKCPFDFLGAHPTPSRCPEGVHIILKFHASESSGCSLCAINHVEFTKNHYKIFLIKKKSFVRNGFPIKTTNFYNSQTIYCNLALCFKSEDNASRNYVQLFRIDTVSQAKILKSFQSFRIIKMMNSLLLCEPNVLKCNLLLVIQTLLHDLYYIYNLAHCKLPCWARGEGKATIEPIE